MISRGAILAFPMQDPRSDVRDSLAWVGDPPPDGIVTLQGGLKTSAWGYVTCALAWSLANRRGTLPISAKYGSLPLPMHRFPVSWLANQTPIGLAENLDDLVAGFMAACRLSPPSPAYTHGTVFALPVETFKPETAGYSGQLVVVAGKALMTLTDVVPDATAFPAVSATTKEPPPGAADWVFKRPGVDVWFMCHEIHTKPQSDARDQCLYRGYTTYPMTEHEFGLVLQKVEFALSRIV